VKTGNERVTDHPGGPVLAELAAAQGILMRYADANGQPAQVDPDVVVALLGVLGVDASTPAAARAALAEVRSATAPVVAVEGETAEIPTGVVILEDGTERAVVDRLPADLPVGYHQLVSGDTETSVIVTPKRLPTPPRTWGWLVQLYALRSSRSWGMGDFGDLADVARRAAADGAGFVLLNPVHALMPGHPVPASPYQPSSRRFVNPLYLRVDAAAAHQRADPDQRAAIDALRPDNSTDLIDYDAIWSAKRTAFERLWTGRDREVEDAALRDFATYCALAERHGRDWRQWPAALRRPAGPAVAAARVDLADRVAFHAWLQRMCDDQLAAARQAAAGMPVGLVQDLAVGIDPGGADAWLLQDVLAEGVRVGAPPDAFSQLGQDWGLAAWRPDRLAAAGYVPYRDLVRAMLRNSGGLRVDHVAGLWRLWWIPPGGSAADGAYVRYDPRAMVGILALEAQRAGAVIIGEDLGTVEQVVTDGLAERNMLGCTVLWFARGPDGADFAPVADWPVNSLASVSTHDLPTAAGFLNAEHVRVRAELGLLTRDEAAERADAGAERDKLFRLLRAEGVLDATAPSDEEIIVAMHRLLARAPSRFVAVSPYDVLGEVRQPNLPGTVDEYPNWRLPLPTTLDDLFADPRVRAVTALMSQRR
jgi:4-alpha-glucanotransferase